MPFRKNVTKRSIASSKNEKRIAIISWRFPEGPQSRSESTALLCAIQDHTITKRRSVIYTRVLRRVFSVKLPKVRAREVHYIIAHGVEIKFDYIIKFCARMCLYEIASMNKIARERIISSFFFFFTARYLKHP